MITNLLVIALVCLFVYFAVYFGWVILSTACALIFRSLLKPSFFRIIIGGIWGAVIGAGVFFFFSGFSLGAASTGAVLGAVIGAIWALVKKIKYSF